uniref:Uncharacterized protein n=1 Tax=Chromera velia CCMP2878 TaxID=1169474 RepID=A0A0G4H8S3_9ALVE|eukprot:Cvel_25264.t1-p1 / transcript=Cvel_25264.t1 / gene=Cvel_25264 / organism=Chromera_velia_CCMP2878 / gene_product=hypothetical protein / transcript_product=hypothetical protein / location=Cvel_scaffold2836:6286-6540(-) / protein_length=85 / sequence_SO=supercontig / SO=protein_coding / is_pseudo=false
MSKWCKAVQAATPPLQLNCISSDDKVDNGYLSWWCRDDLVEAASKNAALATEVFQATNVAGVSERRFSLYDQVYSEKRNHLTLPH